MLPEGKEHARKVIAEARQIRRSLNGSAVFGSSNQGANLLLIKSYDQLLELADALLSEQEAYESRLHRSRHADAGNSLPMPHPQ